MRGKLPKHEVGSGNVFADVGMPDAELHLLDTGHFALEDKGDEIARLMLDFLDRKLPSR